MELRHRGPAVRETNPAQPATFAVALDGITPLPPGKLATLVTYLECRAAPAGPRLPPPPGIALDRVIDPDLDWYRRLYARIGDPWLWFSRRLIGDDALRAILTDPVVEVHVVTDGAEDVGLVELDRRQKGEVEVAFFGLVPEAIGRGIGRWLIGEALRLAFAAGPTRVWLHTCSFDHPGALRFYTAAGFRPYRLALEVADDPRLTGHLPRTAAPHVPLVEP